MGELQGIGETAVGAAAQAGRIEVALRKYSHRSQRKRIREGLLVAGADVSRSRIGRALFQTMHQSAHIDAVIEYAEPAASNQLGRELVSESNARSEVAQRNMTRNRQVV